MYYKVIKSGQVYELYSMEYEPIPPNMDSDNDDYDAFSYAKKKMIPLDDEEKKGIKLVEDRTEQRRKQTTRDARNKVKRLVLSNFNKNSKFITLTFKDNITDIDLANKKFKKFIRYMREKIMLDKKLKYLAVIEFQERGSVHYHMICNIPYTPHSVLWSYWKQAIEGEGSLNIKNIQDVDNVGAYIVKYMMKNSNDERLKGKKCYLNSQGLKQPEVYKGAEGYLIYKSILEKNKKNKIFDNQYESEYLGKIQYIEYNFNVNSLYRKQRKKAKQDKKIK